MKKRRITYLIACCTILCILLDNKYNIINNHLFMETRKPAYSNCFWSGNAKKKSFKILDLNSANRLAVNALREAARSGIELKLSDDGSITITGENKTEQVIIVHLSPAHSLSLDDGEYRVSCDTNTPLNDSILFYFEGRYVDPEGIQYSLLAQLPDNPVFTLRNELYEDIGLVLAFTPLFETKEPITIHPQIRRADDPSDEYMPPAVIMSTIEEDETGFQIFLVDKAEFNQLTDSDWKIFKNNLKYQYQGPYIWTSIIFEDGTGVQFVDSDPDQAIYGAIDPWGRVDEPLCVVNSLDKIKAAFQPV